MATTSERVLSMPEILEAILLRLSLRDLLVHAQLVNRVWRDLISTSPTLQQTLFFLAQTCNLTQASKFNPLLQTAFPA
jgi:hypothetical protein